MTFILHRLSAQALTAGLMGLASLQPAQAYELLKLNGVEGGYDMNNAGLVVGAASLNLGGPVTWLSGTTSALAQPSPVVAFAATSVSQNGFVVGPGVDPGVFEGKRSVRWQGNSYAVLSPTPFGTGANAYAVNDGGVAVGYTTTGFPEDDYTATAWDSNGAPSLLRSLDRGSQSIARDINNDGLVVGSSTVTLPGNGFDVAQRAVQWFQGLPTALLSPGAGTFDDARGISESGLIVGTSRDAVGRDRAALWIGASDLAFDLGTLTGNDSSWANAVNRSGQAVGSSYQYSYPLSNRAVLWDGFVATDLNLYLSPEQMQAGWRLYDATSINDAGAILVNGVNDVSNEYQAFLLTAVPEPGTWALWLAGLAGVGATARRRAMATSA